MNFYDWLEKLDFKMNQKIKFILDQKEYNGEICGLSCEFPVMWIVKCEELFSEIYPYNFCCIAQSYMINENE